MKEIERASFPLFPLFPLLPVNLLSKLRATLREHQLLNQGDAVVVGVSGGPDSLTLLHALKILAPEWELKLFVAHLNHQLRGEDADADEEFVVWLAREWGLPIANARWDVGGYADENGLSIEQAARILRYQFLSGVANQVKANAIAVAHNADDQVETILLHFLRGAGLSGLRGMAYKSSVQYSVNSNQWHSGTNAPVSNLQSPISLIRPLLDITRAEIEMYCVENNLQPRTDESNFDTAILRNRLRHEVIPYLENINPNLREVLRNSALSIADDFAYIQQNVLGIFERMARPLDGGFVFDKKWFRALPVNLQRGVLREAVARLRRLKNIGFPHIENARRIAAENDAGAEATLPQGLLLVVGYDDFTIGEHIPLPDEPLLLHGEEIILKVAISSPKQGQIANLSYVSRSFFGIGEGIEVGDEILLPESDWGIRVVERRDVSVKRLGGERWRAMFDAEKIRGPLVLRTRRAGERFAPKGMGGKHKSLHEFMIDEKIPRHLRECIPILADEEKVLWVVGYRQDERTAVRLGDERAQKNDASAHIIHVEFFKNLDA